MQKTATYPQRLYSIVKQNQAEKGVIFLDLSNEEHYKCAMDMFGGGQSLRDGFPAYWQAINNARDDAESKNVAEGDLVDYSSVNDAFVDESTNELYSFGYTNLAERARAMSQVLFVFKNGKLIDRAAASSYGSTYSRIENATPTKEEIEAGDEMTFVLHTSWQAEGDEAFKSMIAYDIRDTAASPLDEVVAGIEVIDPRHRFSPENSEITLAYGRGPKEHEVIDYTYQKIHLEQRQKVFLENRGIVTLLDGVEFVAGDPENTTIVLNHGTMGSVQYSNVIGEEAFAKLEQNAFKWDFDCDWNATVPCGTMKDSRVYGFDMRLAFFAKREGEEPKRYFVNVSSYQKEESPHYKHISNIKVLWGCLAEGSLVLMADGTEKPIEDVRAGDRVMGLYRFPLKVVNTYEGTEDEMFVVRTDDGKEVMATITHPFLTEEGMVPVEELQISDRLEMENGWLARLDQCYPVHYGGKVYNLDIEGAQPFICNDFVVGDFATQNLNREPKGRIIEIPEGLVEETERILKLVA